MHHFDPITLEIIQHAVQATADEMFAAMRRTAMSAIIYEVLDMGTGVLDRHGELAGSGAGIPSFVGVLDKTVKRLRQRFDRPGAIQPGDVFIVNDPYSGGVTHLNDVVLAMPVFAPPSALTELVEVSAEGGVDPEIVAWTANIAHWNDIGGMAPGSMSTNATELFQEGLIIPGIKLIDAGTPVQSVFDILTANCRMPDFLIGDLWAGIAALRIGARRLQETVGKYGREYFLYALAAYMDYGEQVSLSALAELPKGTFTLQEEQDNGQIYSVEIEIRDDAFVVDLTNNPDQNFGPFNMSADRALVACQMAFKNITSPARAVNGGTFRPLQVKLREGSVFHPRHPAAVGINFEIGIRLYDLLLRCLAQAMPERLPAGGFTSICGTLFGGIHPDTGRPYAVIEPEIGGWGATAYRDGAGGQFSPTHGETYNCPAEVAEARYGVTVDHLGFHDEPGGAGQFRGGKGVRIDYRIRTDNAWLTVAYTRAKMPPWPLQGGQPGSTKHVLVRRADGRCERHAVVSGLKLHRDDVIQIMTATGAGWGDPRRRDPALVEADLRNGFTTRDDAREIYCANL
ncbi:MAG: hydantoinase B/oxoprolinase family protein [Caldilineaceae bacterium]